MVEYESTIWGCSSRHAGTIVGQGGGQQEQKGTDLHGHLFRTPPNIGTTLGQFSFYPLAGPIFYTIMQINLSSNHILLVYTA